MTTATLDDTREASSPAVVRYTEPWSGLGVDVEDGALTAREAIHLGGLDWDVQLRKAGCQDPDTGEWQLMNPPFYGVYRTDNRKQIGKVGSRYSPLQNREVFQFADNLVDDASAKYVRVFSTGGGAKVFALMRFPEDVLIDGEDPHRLYGLLSTAHNGCKATSFHVVLMRVRCCNMVQTAVRGAKHYWSVPHVGSAKGRIQEARDSLGLTFKYVEEFQSTAKWMRDCKVRDDRVFATLHDVIPARPKTDEVIDQIMELYRTSDVNGYRGTIWGAYNAFTEYYDHRREVREPSALLHAGLSGHVATWRANFAEALLYSE